MAKPLLSIGIIFRDDIRCIERCLSSLAPLREAIPCELVMADTGSVDGSRAVAEKYADILFDFPWVNDFAAARNAVMSRCSGRWYFSIDTDEWLDEDIKALVGYLRANKKSGEACTVVIRNYMTKGDDSDYRDFVVTRLARISTGIRYHGVIHEMLRFNNEKRVPEGAALPTILHHDGYMTLNEEAGAAKRKRNMDLLLKELEKDPDSLRLLMQCIESTGAGKESLEYIRRGIAATEAKQKEWLQAGPVIFRYAVNAARGQKLEELHEWAARAEELFPKSFYTRIDIYYQMFTYHWVTTKNNDECIRLGEGYLKAVADYNAGRGDQAALRMSTLTYAAPNSERALRSVLAHAYFQAGQPERALEMLDTIDFSAMDEEQTTNSVLLLRDLQKSTAIDTAPLVLRLYEGICKPTPSEERAEERKKIFSDLAAGLFSSMEDEEKSEGFTRRSCTMLAPLAGQHPLGDAAAVLMAETASEQERLLAAADKPYAMPREVLRRAILNGVGVPLREKPLNMEEMNSLARQLAREDGLEILSRAVDAMDAGLQQLAWAKSVVLAVVGSWKWVDEEQNSKQSMDLARIFVRVEEAFLSHCYAPELLCEENIWLLPAMHRLGWHCGRAFEALDADDPKGYVRRLRAGLESTPGMKDMVKFLTENVPQLQAPAPSAEMLELAEKVRAMLSMFSPDDPAVAELKASPVYQEVAHLIEGIEAPILGGLPQ